MAALRPKQAKANGLQDQMRRRMVHQMRARHDAVMVGRRHPARR